METGLIDPAAYEVLMADIIAEAHNHADAEEAAARDPEDHDRARALRRLATEVAGDLDRRLSGVPAAQVAMPW